MAQRLVQGYEMVRRLDRGEGDTLIYEARHVETDMQVAIKVIPFDDETALEAAKREVKILAKIDHKNIVHLKHAFSDEGKLHIVMQFVPGGDLARLMSNFSVANLDNVRALGIQVCQALQHLHDRDVFHCDVKPSNILIADPFWEHDYERDHAVKLTDFGISEILRHKGPRFLPGVRQAPTTTVGASSVRGSPLYMAPERFEGHPPSRQSDLWSLGVVLYEVLAGARPFDGEDFFVVRRSVMRGLTQPLPSNVPFILKDAVERCLRLNPEDRFESAKSLKEHLQHFNVREGSTRTLETGVEQPEPEAVGATGKEVQARTRTGTRKGKRSDRKAWPVWVRQLIGVILFLIVAALVYWAMGGFSAEPPTNGG
jgi:serine/threonine protein kinase